MDYQIWRVDRQSTANIILGLGFNRVVIAARCTATFKDRLCLYIDENISLTWVWKTFCTFSIIHTW